MTGAPVIAFVRASGSAYERGHAHGSQLGPQLRAFVADDLCRLNRLLAEPTSLAGLTPQLRAYRDQLELCTPELLDEIIGLADGASISADEALLLQLRRELMGYTKLPTMGDCTTYARRGESAGNTVLAQTVDLNGNLDDAISVLQLRDTATGRTSLLLSFAGLLGYLGLNSDGLAIGINLVLGGSWIPGIPPYLVIRQLLDQAGSVAEALATLPTLPIASSRTLTLCDSTTVACVEILDNELRVVSGPRSVHTNHFLDTEFAGRDKLNPFALVFSRQRLEAATAGLVQLPDAADVAAHFALLSAKPMCVPDRGDIRAERTVAAVVLYPERGELHLRPGNPALSSTEVFSLAAVGVGSA